MLYLIATPIGNLDDMSGRALRILREADVLACEDTRRTWALLSHFGIPRPAVMVSYRQGGEGRAGERLMEWLRAGRTVALCSDGGCPGVSDPGYRLVRQAVQSGIAVQVIPGASAVLAALLTSGLASSSFTFKGYPPRRPGPLRSFFGDERDLPHTLVVFESPHRVAPTLRAALEVLGNRECAVCIELTKKFERVLRGHLAGVLQSLGSAPIRGEVTLVIAGNNPKFSAPDGDGALGDVPPRDPVV